jgi:hypothetical protein
MSKLTIIINLIPYILFMIFGFGSVLIEFYFGPELSKITSKLLSLYYIFPVFLLLVNWIYLENNNVIKKTAISIGSAVIFVVLGFLLMLLFVKFRIELGLQI